MCVCVTVIIIAPHTLADILNLIICHEHSSVSYFFGGGCFVLFCFFFGFALVPMLSLFLVTGLSNRFPQEQW